MVPMLLISLGSAVYANLVMSTEMTCTASITSGSPSIEITRVHVESTNSIDANNNGVIFGEELMIEPLTDGDGKTVWLNITADPIFPEWHLNLTVDIHNTLDSIPVNLHRTLYYYDSSISNWVECNEDALLNLSGIRYFDAWYNTTSGELITDITTYELWVCETVTVLESVAFDGQYFSELQGQSFCFMVVITPTYPNGG